MKKPETIKIFCDGGSRGNPGLSASAFVVYDSENKIIHKQNKFLGITTNNVAEYTAVLMAHEWLDDNAKKNGIQKIKFTLDSELVTKQLNGIYKIKSPNLISLVTKIKKIQSNLSPIKVNIAHVLRARNKVADQLVNDALDEKAA